MRQQITDLSPEIIFHLAAQPLVRRSYEFPRETWATNVMGTVHLLDVLRDFSAACAVVVVTTDKVYHNREWLLCRRVYYGYSQETSVELNQNKKVLFIDCIRFSKR